MEGLCRRRFCRKDNEYRFSPAGCNQSGRFGESGFGDLSL